MASVQVQSTSFAPDPDESSAHAYSFAICGYPAIRRTLRFWREFIPRVRIHAIGRQLFITVGTK